MPSTLAVVSSTRREMLSEIDMKHAHLLLWIAVCAAAVAPVGAAETGGLRYS